jgi:RNA polymerase sigma-70 factor (ECF subfamily)
LSSSSRPSPSAQADFEAAIVPHLPRLYNAALRMAKTEDGAQDLVQETVLRACRFFDTFQAGSNSKAWLFRILANVFNSRYRARAREQDILQEAESSEANVGQFMGRGPRDAEAAVLGVMMSRDVERAFDALPDGFRVAVILADLEDFSYKEIADILDCPAGTVMSRLYRGRKILQQQLYRYAVEQGLVSADRAQDEERADTLDLDEYRRKQSEEA